MVESLLLALIGSGLGWMLATWAISTAVPWAPSSIPRLAEVSVDGKVLGFAALIAIAAAALLTVAPLGAVLRARAGDVLRLAGRGAVGDRWSGRVRQALVIGEISAALLLLLTTTVLLQNVLRLVCAQLSALVPVTTAGACHKHEPKEGYGSHDDNESVLHGF
jgi:putative ABC transport system permease protein